MEFKIVKRQYDTVCKGSITRKAVSFTHLKNFDFFVNIEKDIKKMFPGKDQLIRINHSEKFIQLAYENE